MLASKNNLGCDIIRVRLNNIRKWTILTSYLNCNKLINDLKKKQVLKDSSTICHMYQEHSKDKIILFTELLIMNNVGSK